MNEKLREYNEMLIAKNAVMNLTSHETIAESWQKNIEDSLLFVDEFAKLGRARLLDIGAGGGLPGIPIALECPDLHVTMVDSVNKKIEFIKEVINKLQIPNASAVHARAEDFILTNRGSFDAVTAKAVAALPTLLEYAIPFLKTGGRLYAFKGQNYGEEIRQSKNALRLLGAKVERTEEKKLDGEVTRFLIIIKKTAKTEQKYPRQKNLPRLRPLL
jgi:16S rRNA (guanine527-N7)-methyltransferase